MAIDIKIIKELRDKTSAGVSDVRAALEEADGDIKAAEKILKEKGIANAAKKADRETGEGLVESYVHQGRVGAMVEVLCETDFVARTDEFKTLAHEIAMQVASMNPKDTAALLKQEYIRDPQKTIGDLVKESIAKVGENITVGRITRFELGK
ncbi:MAG TPA: translation elongation factor Ts [Patescibacteria group bacterium]|nr:translation elongation factor Ts [Patescibacteria group bacterium]